MPLLLACIGIALVILFARLFATAARPDRVDRFARAHALDLDPADRPALLRYLSGVRRLRVAGVLVALIGCLAASLDGRDKVTVYLTPLLAGWLAGAVAAELVARAAPATPAAPDDAVDDAVVARWMRMFGAVLAGVAVVSTVLTLTLAPSRIDVAVVVWWGVAALACAGAVTLVTRRVLTRPVHGGILGPRTERAVRVNAIGGVTAIGTLAAAACLSGQAVAVYAAMPAVTPLPGAVQEATVGLGIGALVVAFFTVLAARPVRADDGSVTPPSAARPRLVVWVAVAALVGSAAWVGRAWQQTVPPYGPAAVHPTASITLTTDADFATDASALGVTGMSSMVTMPHQRQFVGRLDFAVPAAAHGAGRYAVVVIDSLEDHSVPWLGDKDGNAGFDGFLIAVPQRYPWLSGMAPLQLGNGYEVDTNAIWSDSDATEALEFQGLLSPDSAVETPAGLTVALIFIGPDQQVYWATKVPVTG